MEEIKKGDIIYDLQSKELHKVTKEPDEQGYLEVQFEAFYREGVEGGKNIIHKSEIDDIYLKKL